MKIPQILAQSDVPIPPRSSSAMDAAGAPNAALAEGIDRLERSVVGSLERYGAADEKKKEQERVSDSISAFGEVVTEMDNRESGLENGVRDQFGNMTAAPATDKDYLDRWKKDWTDSTGKTLGKIQDPDTKRRVQNLLERERMTRESRALSRQNKMGHERAIAALDESATLHAERAALDPDPRERERAEKTHLAEIAALEGISLNPVQAGDRRRAFTQTVKWTQGVQAVKERRFDVKDVQGLAPDKIMALVEMNTTEGEKREQRVREGVTRMKEGAYGEIMEEVRQPGSTYTATDFRKDQAHLQLDPAKAQAIYNTIVGRDVDDDPLVIKEVASRSRKATTLDEAKRNKAWLDEMHTPSDGGPQRISTKSYQLYDAIYTSRVDSIEGREMARTSAERAESATQRAQASQERSERRQERAMFEDKKRDTLRRLERRLQVGSDLDRLTRAGTSAFDLAEEWASAQIDQGADPVTVLEEATTRYLPLIADKAKQRARAIRDSMPHSLRSLGDLGSRENARARFGMTADEHHRVMKMFHEAERIEEGVLELTGKRPAPMVGAEKLGPSGRGVEIDPARRRYPGTSDARGTGLAEMFK